MSVVAGAGVVVAGSVEEATAAIGGVPRASGNIAVPVNTALLVELARMAQTEVAVGDVQRRIADQLMDAGLTVNGVYASRHRASVDPAHVVASRALAQQRRTRQRRRRRQRTRRHDGDGDGAPADPGTNADTDTDTSTDADADASTARDARALTVAEPGAGAHTRNAQLGQHALAAVPALVRSLVTFGFAVVRASQNGHVCVVDPRPLRIVRFFDPVHGECVFAEMPSADGNNGTVVGSVGAKDYDTSLLQLRKRHAAATQTLRVYSMWLWDDNGWPQCPLSLLRDEASAMTVWRDAHLARAARAASQLMLEEQLPDTKPIDTETEGMMATLTTVAERQQVQQSLAGMRSNVQAAHKEVALAGEIANAQRGMLPSEQAQARHRLAGHNESRLAVRSVLDRTTQVLRVGEGIAVKPVPVDTFPEAKVATEEWYAQLVSRCLGMRSGHDHSGAALAVAIAEDRRAADTTVRAYAQQLETVFSAEFALCTGAPADVQLPVRVTADEIFELYDRGYLKDAAASAYVADFYHIPQAHVKKHPRPPLPVGLGTAARAGAGARPRGQPNAQASPAEGAPATRKRAKSPQSKASRSSDSSASSGSDSDDAAPRTSASSKQRGKRAHNTAHGKAAEGSARTKSADK